jgi:hypothetical protein
MKPCPSHADRIHVFNHVAHVPPRKIILNPTMDTRIRDETSRLGSHLTDSNICRFDDGVAENHCTAAVLEDSIVEDESLGLLVDFRWTAPEALFVLRGIDRKVYDVA